MRETENSHEKECEYWDTELGPLMQFITFSKYGMLCANIAYLCGSLFIPTSSAFHDFVLNGPRHFPLLVLAHTVSNKVRQMDF